jgi:holo-[acyl-carrier protein] synthase
MIIGVGSDLCDARRIAKVLDRHGDRFLDRIFTRAERAKAEGRAKPVETYAKRFAAKEACSKALGTGLPSGRPTMKLTGGALARLQAITPAGCEAQIDVSLTDDGPTAQAIVIISAVPSAKV